MSRSPRARRWPLRLLQFSPLVALFVLAAVWFSIPYDAALQLATAPAQLTPAQGMTPEIRVRMLGNIDESRIADDLHLGWEDDSFHVAAERDWVSWVGSLPVRPQPSDVLSPSLAPDSERFASVAAWGRKNSVRVWSWIVPAPPKPFKVLSATGDPRSLGFVEGQLRGEQARRAEEVSSTTPVPKTVGDFLWSQSRGVNGLMAPLNTAELSLGDIGGGTSGGYYTADYSLRDTRGGVWRAFIVGTPESPDELPQSEPLAAFDPGAPDAQKRLRKIAAAEKINIWVLGPLRFDAIPMRVPVGATAAQAQELGALIWPELGVREMGNGYGVPRSLPVRAQSLAGGVAGYVDVTGPNTTGWAATENYAPDEIAPQTVAWLAVYDEMPPALAPGALRRAWLSWRRFAAAWFPFALGGAMGLLALSLVAAPSAYIYERRLIARERVREEMARMRRDAHDKVYNRLSALSKRVAAAGDQVATTDSSATLSSIAEEIRGTVGELQEILGDEARHTNSALTTVPLADQLSSVAAAQAARLGVSVEVEAADVVPEVSADLGWDLQCITEEAVTNAVRHGGATHVGVALAVEGDALILTVTDDGGGSRVTRPEDAPEGSTGLLGMRDRLERRGGEFTLTTGDAGTVLSARAPLL